MQKIYVLRFSLEFFQIPDNHSSLPSFFFIQLFWEPNILISSQYLYK
jgi:hypothetical protein